jgi:hypothetical protein
MRIFLSHASEDKDDVKRMLALLPSFIHEWLDENQLQVGKLLSPEIREAILQECHFLIVFVSKVSIASEWVQKELAWAIERESALKRPFILPILLDDVRTQLKALKVMDDRRYLECFDRSGDSIKRTAEHLQRDLFALVWEYLVDQNPQSSDTSQAKIVLSELRSDLVNFKEKAFRLHASLSDSVAVISTNPAAFEEVSSAVNDYNLFTQGFIQRCTTYSVRIGVHWGRNLADECRQLLDFVEQKIYRGQVYALNSVREILNKMSVTGTSEKISVMSLDKEKDAKLAKVLPTLSKMSRMATKFLGKLEREL